MEYYSEALRKYAVFTGRARRKEYWMFFLWNFIIAIIFSIITAISYGRLEFLSVLYAIVLLIPGIAVAVRRLHDTNRNGWWFLIGLIPIVGTIILIVFLAKNGQVGENRYGPDPKSAVQLAHGDKKK